MQLIPFQEAELEEKVQHLATHLGPLYERVASDSYRNQIEHENEGLECRLGYRPGRPFSGVTACLDYCSHAHKDAHNMINGCTVVLFRIKSLCNVESTTSINFYVNFCRLSHSRETERWQKLRTSNFTFYRCISWTKRTNMVLRKDRSRKSKRDSSKYWKSELAYLHG